MSKVNSGTILLAFLAVLFGLGGTYLLRKSMNRTPAPRVEQVVRGATRPNSKITVPMTSRVLEAGHRVSLDDIALVRLTREDMKKYGIKAAFMTNPDQIIGKTLKQPLERGETFDTKYFYPLGIGMGISQRIKPGQRAITVLLTPTNALMGFAGAGQKVDVMFHYGEQNEMGTDAVSNSGPETTRFNSNRSTHPTYANGRNGANGARSGNSRANSLDRKYRSATVTIVQNAEILALGDKAIPTNNSLGVPGDQRIPVTLLLSPGDAQKVKVADGHGELSLTLRAADDRSYVELADASKLENILKIEDSVRSIQVFRGQNQMDLHFDSADSISPRIVDSPKAYDPSKVEFYDPNNNMPWSGNDIPSKPAGSRGQQNFEIPYDNQDAYENQETVPSEEDFGSDGGWGQILKAKRKPQPLFDNQSAAESSAPPVPFGSQVGSGSKSGPLKSSQDEILETLEMFGSPLGGRE